MHNILNMAVHFLQTIQRIPTSMEDAWAFFSNPAKLQEITPGNMGFTVLTQGGLGEMYPGQIIEYTVKPLAGISMYWMTEITHVSEGRFFVDEQRVGPYSIWHHQHHFKEIAGGIEMTDKVHYRIPLGLLGELANGLFVKKRLREIFEFRYHQVENIFGKWEGERCEVKIV